MQRKLPNRRNADGKLTTEYLIWQHAKDRCNNEKHVAYVRYGGRGIKMCAEWEKSFDAFFAYLGKRPEGKTLDRIDNDKGYEPGNVQWSDRLTQARNRSNVRFSPQEHGMVFETLHSLGYSQSVIARAFDTAQGVVGRYIRMFKEGVRYE